MKVMPDGLKEACMKVLGAGLGDQVTWFDPLEPFFVYREMEDGVDYFYLPHWPGNGKHRPDFIPQEKNFWYELTDHFYADLTPYSPIYGCGTGFVYAPGFGNEVWWNLQFDGGGQCPRQDDWLPVSDELADYFKVIFAKEIEQFKAECVQADILPLTDEGQTTAGWSKPWTGRFRWRCD